MIFNKTACDPELQSPLRIQLNVWLEKFAMELNLQGKKILEIGIGGDEKPSGSYKIFGKGNKWTTMDINPKWEPDMIDDICDCGIADNEFDLVIMTQTLEHIWDYKKALSEIYRITKKYAIVDCPFAVEFHVEEVRREKDWRNWDDYWRFTPATLNRLLKEAGFKKVDLLFKPLLPLLTVALCEK